MRYDIQVFYPNDFPIKPILKKKIMLNLKRLPSLEGIEKINENLEGASEIMLWCDLDAKPEDPEMYRLLRMIQNVKLVSLKFCPDFETFSFLRQMPFLEELEIYHAGGRKFDLSSLRDCKNVKKLLIHKTKFYESEDLLPENLKELHLSSLKIVDLNFINHLTKLEQLKISNCKCENWASLGGKNVRKLQIFGNNSLKDIGFVNKLARLEWLMIDQLSGLGKIGSLDGLESLTFFRGERLKKLKNIDGLAAAKNLEILWLMDAPSLEMNGIRKLAKLPKLFAGCVASGNREIDETFSKLAKLAEDYGLIWGKGGEPF